MSQKITYKKELFDFINELTAINNSIGFERVGDRIVVRKADKNRTLPYIVSVPSSYFDIDETIAFYKYDHFYKFLTSIKNAELHLDDPNIIISKAGKTPINIDYRLSEEEGIINGPAEKIEFDEWDVQFVLSAEDLDEIVKINRFVKGTNARIECVDDEVKLSIYSSGNDNTFDKSFTCERIGNSSDEFAFVINANRFEFLPSKRDYTINISSEKFVKISLIHDEIEFDMYSGDME